MKCGLVLAGALIESREWFNWGQTGEQELSHSDISRSRHKAHILFFAQ
jgi:hypothetical protein